MDAGVVMCEGSVESTIRLCNELVVVAAWFCFMTTKKTKQKQTKKYMPAW